MSFQIVQLCQMLQASLDEANLGSMSPEELEAVFIQSVYASLGASLVAEAQTVFDAHVKNLTGFLNVVDSDDRLANYSKWKKIVLGGELLNTEGFFGGFQ